jgi:hypothetical protein
MNEDGEYINQNQFDANDNQSQEADFQMDDPDLSDAIEEINPEEMFAVPSSSRLD